MIRPETQTSKSERPCLTSHRCPADAMPRARPRQPANRARLARASPNDARVLLPSGTPSPRVSASMFNPQLFTVLESPLDKSAINIIQSPLACHPLKLPNRVVRVPVSSTAKGLTLRPSGTHRLPSVNARGIAAFAW